jgi:hypothetical protein
MKLKINIKNFSTKFIDIMIGIILGLGFQWWPNLKEPWQYVAFIFVYLDVVDYWVDYGPSLKKFPPKKEIDVLLDLAICFSLFLYIYSTQYTVVYFIMALGLVKIFDFIWLLSSKLEYKPDGFNLKYLDTWMFTDGLEIMISAIIVLIASVVSLPSLSILIVFILARLGMRIYASFGYKKIYLAN